MTKIQNLKRHHPLPLTTGETGKVKGGHWNLEFIWDLEIGNWDFIAMLPKELLETLQARIASAEHPRELAVDIMLASQNHYGYLSDEALEEAARLLGMTPLELEELATFYDFIYREPVGRFVIHVCDGVVCWMNGYDSVLGYLMRKLGIKPGETTQDGLFTLLPTACIGYCDLSPAMLINGRAYGPLTPEKIDDILGRLRAEPPKPRMAR